MAKKKSDNVFRLIQLVGDYPSDLYKTPSMGRKWKRLTQDMALLVGKLARYGDPDGTTIRPAIETIRKQLCWSERKVFRMLDRLLEHGMLRNEPHYHGEHGPRVRILDVDMLAAQRPAKAYQREAGLPDTKILPIAGLPHTVSGLPHTKAGLPDTHSRTATLRGTLPPSVPPKTPPPPPPVKPGVEAGAVVSDLQRAYQQSTGKVLPVSGKGVKAKLSAMVAPYSPATVASAVEKWNGCRTAPASGLRNPAQFLEDELPDFLAQTDTAEKAAAELAEKLPRLQAQAQAMSAKYWAWVKQLEEFGNAESAKYLAAEYPPHDTVIDAAVEAWVTENPAPTTGPWEIDEAGRLFNTDIVSMAVQSVKSKIVMATEQMGAELTE